MPAPAQTGESEPPSDVASGPARGRRLLLRGFVLALLLAGAAAVGAAVLSFVGEDRQGESSRRAELGVLMPDATAYRRIVNELLARRRPVPLRGMTIVGAQGVVTVLKADGDNPSFPSAYLNPNALSVLARSIGMRSDLRITVEDLRLEMVRATGRLRWRLRGVQGERPWRAVIAPNGTHLRLLKTRVS